MDGPPAVTSYLSTACKTDKNHSLWLHSELSEGKVRDTHSKGGDRFKSNVLPLASTLLSFLHYSGIIPSMKQKPKRSSSSKYSFSFLDEEKNVGARVAW